MRWLWILVAMSPRRQIPPTASAEEYEHDMLTHIPFRSWHVGQDARLCHVEGDRAGAAVPQCVSTSPCRRSGQRAANLLM